MTQRRTWFLLNEGWIVLVVDSAEHAIPPLASGEPNHRSAELCTLAACHAPDPRLPAQDQSHA